MLHNVMYTDLSVSVQFANSIETIILFNMYKQPIKISLTVNSKPTQVYTDLIRIHENVTSKL